MNMTSFLYLGWERGTKNNPRTKPEPLLSRGTAFAPCLLCLVHIQERLRQSRANLPCSQPKDGEEGKRKVGRIGMRTGEEECKK